MRVHLVNPSDESYGIAVVTPRWLYVIAAATPSVFGDPVIVDEMLDRFDAKKVEPGDVVGIGIYTSNALRGYEVGRRARERGAYVIFGGIHASLYPGEAYELGGAHSVVKGDGELVWPKVLADCDNGGPQSLYEAGRIEADGFLPARWELVRREDYLWASVQTMRGCPKHCSFCSVWRTDGQRPRQRAADRVIQELVELRRKGFRCIVLGDDNFYPVTLQDLKLAESQGDQQRLRQLQAIRAERFELMARMAELPEDMVFFTQITMEAAEDPEFLKAMRKASITGALVGIESVTAEGLKSIYKGFNSTGESLIRRLRAFRQYGVHVLGSFIFGLPTDGPETFQATLALAQEADLPLAQFLMLIPYPGTVDFLRWEKQPENSATRIAGIPMNRYWLMPKHLRPNLFSPHPRMTHEEICREAQNVWNRFYTLPSIWKRSRFVNQTSAGAASRQPHGRATVSSRLTFVLFSLLFRKLYFSTGITIDSARAGRAVLWVRWVAKPLRRLFHAKPMPELKAPSAPALGTL